MTGARGGLLYLGAAALLGYLWVTGNLSKLAAKATAATSGSVVQKPITLPKFKAR